MEQNLSRRNLGKLLLPAAAVTLGNSTASRHLLAQTTQSTEDVRTGIIYNVRDHGAVGDGKANDTDAIQRAIDTCAAAGGGTVLIPPGRFLIGTLELKSHITLHLSAGGTLLGSANGKHYRAIDQVPLHGDTTLEDGNWALLFAVNAQNIAIEGDGSIDGQGAAFRSSHGSPAPSGLDGLRRPYHLLLYRCESVRLRDISLLDSAYHSVRVIQSRRISIDGLYIHNRVNTNNDGFHFVSAQHVTISNCVVICQDDACALFGSCQYITVTNSSFSTRWSVFRFGGGHVRDIVVSNCLLYEVYGCPIKFQGNAGNRFENISFSNLIFDRVTGPVSISIGASSDTSAQGEPPVAKNISFHHLQGTIVTSPPDELPESALVNSAYPGELHSCIVLNAVRGATLENISFSDIQLTFTGGDTSDAGRDVPLTAGEYFKLGTPPAYALYARNVRGLTLQNMRFQLEKPDVRPALSFDNVQDVTLNGISLQANEKGESVVRCVNSRRIYFTAVRVLTPALVFLQVEGKDSEGIIVDGGDLALAATPVVYKKGAQSGSVRLRTIS